MKLFALTTLLGATLVACGPSAPHSTAADWTVTSAVDVPDSTRTRFVLADGRQFTVGLREATLLTSFSGGPAWLVFSGWECTDCDAERAVWIVRADSVEHRSSLRHHPFPGEHVNPFSDSAFFRSRLFLGACRSAALNEAVWLQERKDSTGAWQRLAHVVELDSAFRTSEARWTDSLEQRMLARVANAAECREVLGQRQAIY